MAGLGVREGELKAEPVGAGPGLAGLEFSAPACHVVPDLELWVLCGLGLEEAHLRGDRPDPCPGD